MDKIVKKIVQRDIFPQIIKHLQAPEMTVIIGPRQVGKTTLLFQCRDYLLKHGYSQDDIFIFNLDLIRELNLFSSQEKFIAFLKERIGKRKIFVFVDEAQRVQNAGKFFKGIYDLHLPVKFVLTGSSSLEIKAKIHESLMGRKRVFRLYPFSFQEYLSAFDSRLAKIISQKEISAYSQEKIIEYLSNFLVWGGYPRVALEEDITEKRQLLNELFSTYIEKDIVGFLRIQHHTDFAKLVGLLSNQVGQLVNIVEMSRSSKIAQRRLSNYLEVLEQTFIVERLTPFFKNYQKELVKMPKIYFLDNGLRNMVIDSFESFTDRQDRGTLLENFVFSEILKVTDQQIHFWRTKQKAEVDFVLAKATGWTLPIEVKSSVLTKPVITRSFRNFLDHYHPTKALLVNLGFRGKLKIGETDISFIHPYETGKVVKDILQG